MLRSSKRSLANCILASEWKALAAADTNREIRKMRRHLNHLTTSSTNYIGKNVRDHETPDRLRQASDDQQLGGALEEIQVNSTYFGEFTLTFLLYGEDSAQLRIASARMV